MWRTPVTDIVRGEATVKDFVETHRPYFSRELVKEPGLAPILDQVAGQIGLRKVVFVVRNYDQCAQHPPAPGSGR